MKIKRFDRDQWTVITEKRYIQKSIVSDIFNGTCALLYIDQVREPVQWDFPNESVSVCQKGMKWLQLIPEGESYAITAMLNANDDVNLWYVDVIDGIGEDNDGVYYFIDLYVDVIFRPDGTIKIDDIDELENAVQMGDISTEQFEKALSVKDRILETLYSDIPQLINTCKYCLDQMYKD